MSTTISRSTRYECGRRLAGGGGAANCASFCAYPTEYEPHSPAPPLPSLPPSFPASFCWRPALQKTADRALTGRLLTKTTGQHVRGEDASEQALGRPTDSPTSTAIPAVRKRDVTPDLSTMANSRSSSSPAKKSRKTVTFDVSNAAVAVAAVVATAESSDARKKLPAAAAARHERSCRRQAAAAAAPSSQRRTAAPPDPRRRPPRRTKPDVDDDDDEPCTIVRVPMRTGTLVLYRGAHPRAEFVRSV